METNRDDNTESVTLNYNQKKSTQFWKQVSNGLRTPLNVIKGTADLAQNEIYDIETIKDGLQQIEQSSDFLLSVVNDIVDFVTIENKDLHLVQEGFNLKDLISGFVTKYYNQAKDEMKNLDTMVHGVVHEELLGDSQRVQQILDCMFQNSLKYTSAGDQLCFRIFETGIGEGKIGIRFTLTGSNRRIFDSLCGTVNGKVVTEVTDLALYNSHYILRQMGGEIEVVIDESGNSQIIIDMPFNIAEETNQNIRTEMFANQNILIICDDKEEAEERGELLTDLKVPYQVATDFEGALDAIGVAEERKQPFTACVIDWNVHNFVLQDFVSEVHNIFGKEMPLIAMAYNVDRIEETALKMGFHYVMKHTWFRSTICDLLMKNTQEQWEKLELRRQKKQYNFADKHILVAEDAHINMEFIVRILTNVQAQVSCAVNGVEAVALYEKEEEGYFDCIIMDVNMPEMGGYEATRLIRNSARKDAKTIPIYALTANAFQSDIRETIASGMDGHFSKPVDIDRLYSTLEDVFSAVAQGNYDKSERVQQMESSTYVQEEEPDVDPLTGLLSLRGMEKQVTSLQYTSHPAGALVVDVNDYEHVIERYGQKKAEQLLYIVAKSLKEQFRNSDLVVRYGTSCFVVVVSDCDSQMLFVKNKIGQINEKLTSGADYLNAGICVGAAYSENGYSKNLVSVAFEALNKARKTEKNACCILENRQNQTEQTSFRKAIFGEELFYFDDDKQHQIEQIDDLLTLVLGENQAVGFMCGTHEPQLPITSASGFALKNLGYKPEEFCKLTGAKLENLVYAEDLEVLREEAPGHEREVRKLRLRHKNGDILWFSASYANIIDKNKERMWIASFRPFDDDVIGKLCDMDYQAVCVIFPKENTIIFEKGADVVYARELKLRKKYDYDSLRNSVFVDMHKLAEKEEYLLNTDIPKLRAELDKKSIYEFIHYQVQKDGNSVPLRYKYRYLDEARDAILWTLEVVEGLAESDNVTSLLNENGFYRTVKHEIRAKANTHKNYAILYMNIKDFKSCNEVLGYMNGNMLLRQYAELVEKSTLKPICGARVHADQFYFLIEESNLNYEQLLSLCFRKIKINGNAVNIRVHAGIYRIEDKAQEVAMMCDKAVLATGHITNEYATPYYEFDERVNREYQNRIFVLNNLDRAFNRDEFQVYYQPVCDVKTGKICSAEALVRWIMPGGKVVSPGVFVPVLENKGFISELDLLVANKVQQFMERRIQANQQVVPVSINLSRMDFLNENFLNDLMEQIAQIKIDKSLFRYEVTESAYINVGDDGRNIIDEIRKNHSQIYIDDFGTGYSSLQNLMEIHFDVLKLDMQFIRKIGQSEVAEGIIDATIHVCHALGRKVIAEGVETEAQFMFLEERDCDYIQGYYFYKPMSEQEFGNLLD